MKNALKTVNEFGVRNRFHRERVQFTVPDDEENFVQQQFADEVNINNVVEKFAKTGQIHYLNEGKPNYGIAEPITYEEALQTVIEAQDAFDELPAKVRERYNHDPAQFMKAVHTEGNEIELYDLGLLQSMPESHPNHPNQEIKDESLFTPEESPKGD